MLAEHRSEYSSEWAAMTAISAKLGMTPATFRTWVRQAEIDGGARTGTTDERRSVKELERENRELRRANEILKAASSFFATDRQGSGGGNHDAPMSVTSSFCVVMADRKSRRCSDIYRIRALLYAGKPDWSPPRDPLTPLRSEVPLKVLRLGRKDHRHNA